MPQEPVSWALSVPPEAPPLREFGWPIPCAEELRLPRPAAHAPATPPVPTAAAVRPRSAPRAGSAGPAQSWASGSCAAEELPQSLLLLRSASAAPGRAWAARGAAPAPAVLLAAAPALPAVARGAVPALRPEEELPSRASTPRSLSPVVLGLPPPRGAPAAPASERRSLRGLVSLPVKAKGGPEYGARTDPGEPCWSGEARDGAVASVDPLRRLPSSPQEKHVATPNGRGSGTAQNSTVAADQTAISAPRTPRTPRSTRTPTTPSTGFLSAWLPVGSPVTFFVEGDPQQLFGRMRGMNSDGTYNVDMVGGGRKVGLDAVTPCSEADVLREGRARLGMRYSPSSPLSTSQFSENSTPLYRSFELTPRLSSPPRQYSSGCPVSFHTERSRLQCFGRIRQVHPNGTYTIDLVDGTCKVGVEKVSKCSEEELRDARSWKRDMHTSKHPYADYEAHNPFQSKEESLSIGCQVSFFDRIGRSKAFGRIRNVITDGTQHSYTVDLVGGGVRDVPRVRKCSSEEYASALAAEAQRRFPIKTGLERQEHTALPDSGSNTPNASGSLTPRLRGVAITGMRHQPKHIVRMMLKDGSTKRCEWEGSVGCQDGRMPIAFASS